MRLRRWDRCELCGRGKARVGVVMLLSTRGSSPRVQVNSKSWAICRDCLLTAAWHMHENPALVAAILEFDDRAPKPKLRGHSIAELLAEGEESANDPI